MAEQKITVEIDGSHTFQYDEELNLAPEHTRG